MHRVRLWYSKERHGVTGYGGSKLLVLLEVVSKCQVADPCNATRLSNLIDPGRRASVCTEHFRALICFTMRSDRAMSEIPSMAQADIRTFVVKETLFWSDFTRVL